MVSVLSRRTKPQKRQRCHSPRDSLEPLVWVKKVRTRGGDGDVEPSGLVGDGENAAPASMMKRSVKPSREPNSGIRPAELTGVDEESPVRMEPSQRHC